MRRARPCQRCGIIRKFLMVAVPLVALLWIKPEKVSALAQLMPTTTEIAVGIVVVTTLVFCVRLWFYRRAQKNTSNSH